MFSRRVILDYANTPFLKACMRHQQTDVNIRYGDDTYHTSMAQETLKQTTSDSQYKSARTCRPQT